MKISARNVLSGTVREIAKGAVNSEVSVALQGGETMISIITNSSVAFLELNKGKPVYAIIKASDVMIGKNIAAAKLSARNILGGKVVDLHDGAVNSEVAVRLSGGTTVVATITKASVHALDLKREDEVSAIVKASHVLIGV